MKKTRLINRILKTLIKDGFQYPGRLAVDTIIMVSRCGILLFLYSYVFKLNNGVINNTTFLFSAWSMFFYFSFSVLRLRDISRLIMSDVQTGNIEILFTKPINYLSYRMWWQIGLGIYSFVAITVLAVIVLALIVGFPPTMTIVLFVPTFILAFVGAIILSLFIYAVIGLLAFWIEDINPVFWIVDKTIMILGGSFLPIALFPDFMKKIALYSPFGASQFVTHIVYTSWQVDWYKMIGLQLFWILLFGLIVYFMFQKAKQKVSVNGG